MNTPNQKSVESLTAAGKIYRESELAKLLSISCMTLKRIRYAKEISFLRIGTQVRYTEQHLEDYLQKCQRKSRN